MITLKTKAGETVTRFPAPAGDWPEAVTLAGVAYLPVGGGVYQAVETAVIEFLTRVPQPHPVWGFPVNMPEGGEDE